MTNLEMKVDALMRLCTAETEAVRTEAMATCRKLLNGTTVGTTLAKSTNLDAKIRSVLLDLGVPDHIIGHRYLVCALTLAVNDQDAIRSVTGYLYPAVAERFNTTSSRVECAIRRAVELSWDRGDTEILKKYFGNTVSSHKGKTTNSEFIARIANVIRTQA